jgi:hypothetical protein
VVQVLNRDVQHRIKFVHCAHASGSAVIRSVMSAGGIHPTYGSGLRHPPRRYRAFRSGQVNGQMEHEHHTAQDHDPRSDRARPSRRLSQ